jgi:hypothetical protein
LRLAGAEADDGVGEVEGFEAAKFGGVGFSPGAGGFGFERELLVEVGEDDFVAFAEFGDGLVEFDLLFVAREGQFSDFASEDFEISAGADDRSLVSGSLRRLVDLDFWVFIKLHFVGGLGGWRLGWSCRCR